MCWDIQQLRREYELTREELAEALDIQKSRLEIFESPQDLVPQPVPSDIADRLNIVERALAGRVHRMPQKQCPLHGCWLKQHRGFAAPSGKMRLWWAQCEIFGEFYTVRSDGLVQNPPLAPVRSSRLIDRGKFCVQVIDEMKRIKNLALSTGRSMAEIEHEYPEWVVWKVRGQLPQDDQQTFNSPNQWGPVVGYARMVLGRIHHVSTHTIISWVKAYRKDRKTSAE
jgi:hypothetical protein